MDQKQKSWRLCAAVPQVLRTSLSHQRRRLVHTLLRSAKQSWYCYSQLNGGVAIKLPGPQCILVLSFAPTLYQQILYAGRKALEKPSESLVHHRATPQGRTGLTSSPWEGIITFLHKQGANGKLEPGKQTDLRFILLLSLYQTGPMGLVRSFLANYISMFLDGVGW